MVLTLPDSPIVAPGIYDMTDARYHADPCPTPSLSRSIILRLVDQSARHGWALHPRLGLPPDLDTDTDDEVADFGTAAHASFLQGRSIIRRLDFKDWRTNAAKDARRQAYADGMIPLLVRGYDRAMSLIDVLEGFRARTGAFTKGRPEQTVVWKEEFIEPTGHLVNDSQPARARAGAPKPSAETAIWCRARVDWLPDEPEADPWDLKTTGGFATHAVWAKIAFQKGAYLQDAFYARGLEMVRGEPPGALKFCVVEQNPPYGIAVFQMSPITREIGDQDVRYGIDTWKHCIQTNTWPSYPLTPQWIDPPGWILRERETQALISPRNRDILRGRDHPNAVGYIDTGNFGG